MGVGDGRIERSRRCRRGLAVQRPGLSTGDKRELWAGREPPGLASVTGVADRLGLHHEVSMPTAVVRSAGRCSSWQPAAKVAMMIMRPPQCGPCDPGLLDPDDLLRAVDRLDLQPDHLGGAQAAAIAETERP
jgi:hypothetical protein